MKQVWKTVAVVAGTVLVTFGITGCVFRLRYDKQMQEQQAQYEAELEKELLVHDAVNDLANKYGIEIKDKNDFQKVISGLKGKFDQYFQRENYILDAKEVTSKIADISELATIEYQYTCVGVFDGSKDFKYVNIKNPFESKQLVVEMSGTLKAGIDLSKVKVECDDMNKQVIVFMPKSKILSNELDEKSCKAITEEQSFFNKLTTADQNNVRQQIKDKGKENAKNSGILKMSGDRAQQVIRDLIDSIQKGKGDYEVVFVDAKETE